jgi:hypothetical protein
MCFSENVSLATYLTGMSGSAALLSSNKIPEALFYGFVSQMQLVDYFLWKNQPCEITESNRICNKESLINCNQTNKNVTTAGIIINHLEPLALFGGIVLFSKKTLPLSVIILFYIFMIVISIYTIYIVTKEEELEEKKLCTTVSEESNPHLHWKWNGESFNYIVYPFFIIILILLSYYGLEDGYINATLVVIGYLISWKIYGNKRSTGAMWCFMAAFAPWILYFIYKFKIF